jgi:hypothetical protein
MFFTLIALDRPPVEGVQATLAANETWSWWRLATAINIKVFPCTIRRQCQTGNLSWIDISEQLLVCPPPPAAGRVSIAFNIAITFLVAASRTPLVNAISYGNVSSTRRVSFSVTVVFLVLAGWWTTTSSETLEAVPVPSLRKLAIC